MTAIALCGFGATAIAWSCFTYLDVYAVAAGTVKSVSAERPIKLGETAKVLAVSVAEGRKVRQGEPLVEVEPGDAIAKRSAEQNELADLEAQIARRGAAIEAARGQVIAPAITIPWRGAVPESTRQREQGELRAELSELSASLDALIQERSAKQAERDRTAAAIAAENGYIDILNQQYRMRDALARQNYESRSRVLDALKDIKQAEIARIAMEGKLQEASAAIRELDAKIIQARKDFLRKNEEKRAQAERIAGDLTRKLANERAAGGQLTLTAPIDGRVEGLSPLSAGQMLTAGETLMRIVPEGPPVEIEVFVPKSDIATVARGEDAEIKLFPFHFARSGTIWGRVTHVPESKTPPPTPYGQGFVFPVLVAPSSDTATINGKTIPLTPGMAVKVAIKTEKRRVIDYLLTPVLKAGASAWKQL